MVKIKENVAGIGHQVSFEVKALAACKSSLEQAFADLEGTRAQELSRKIADLVNEANELAGSAEELLNLDY
jgi:hypothetical protein